MPIAKFSPWAKWKTSPDFALNVSSISSLIHPSDPDGEEIIIIGTDDGELITVPSDPGQGEGGGGNSGLSGGGDGGVGGDPGLGDLQLSRLMPNAVIVGDVETDGSGDSVTEAANSQNSSCGLSPPFDSLGPPSGAAHLAFDGSLSTFSFTNKPRNFVNPGTDFDFPFENGLGYIFSAPTIINVFTLIFPTIVDNGNALTFFGANEGVSLRVVFGCDINVVETQLDIRTKGLSFASGVDFGNGVGTDLQPLQPFTRIRFEVDNSLAFKQYWWQFDGDIVNDTDWSFPEGSKVTEAALGFDPSL